MVLFFKIDRNTEENELVLGCVRIQNADRINDHIFYWLIKFEFIKLMK